MAARSLHPFPARMASDLAMKITGDLPPGSNILDPMVGSGTVLEHAISLGHSAIGVDLDPLALLMSRVRCTPLTQFESVVELKERCIAYVKRYLSNPTELSWIDNDEETKAFIDYWFGIKQKPALRGIAKFLKYSSYTKEKEIETDVLRIAFSRLIITKKYGASLAWDVSHSRPHRVLNSQENTFPVLEEFERSVAQTISYLSKRDVRGTARIIQGDARSLSTVTTSSIDAVITSPPYLNAIDYMRGHKLALVWFGYKISELRNIRSSAIGAERGLVNELSDHQRQAVLDSYSDISSLPRSLHNVLNRYTLDLLQMSKEIGRVVKEDGIASFVVGNSFLRGIELKNSEALKRAASFSMLELVEEFERELPSNHRYLPISDGSGDALSKRMRTEVILKFRKQ